LPEKSAAVKALGARAADYLAVPQVGCWGSLCGSVWIVANSSRRQASSRCRLDSDRSGPSSGSTGSDPDGAHLRERRQNRKPGFYTELRGTRLPITHAGFCLCNGIYCSPPMI
jgi:hypothetical protein